MKLVINDQTHTFDQKLSLEAIAQKLGIKNSVCAAVNGRIRELSYLIDQDGEIQFMGLDTHDGMRIYEATLRYVFAMAAYRINPQLKIRFSYSISRSILANLINGEMTSDLYEKIIEEVNRIITEKITIKRLSVSKDEATKIYQKYSYLDKIETLQFRAENSVNLYQTGDYVNYMFSYMLPN